MLKDTLVCACQVEAAKHRKYDSIVRVNGYKMLPFVLSATVGSTPEPCAHWRYFIAVERR